MPDKLRPTSVSSSATEQRAAYRKQQRQEEMLRKLILFSVITLIFSTGVMVGLCFGMIL